MEYYTIDEFWIPRLGISSHITSDSLVKGWSFRGEGPNTFFKEAPLTQSTEQFGEYADPMRSPIILVSAPGAVGKSTLARKIASVTGSVYVDLAKADPVGANTLIGGLVRSGIYTNWTDGKITALIDGLDEAILKTTKEGFETFLDDVAQLSVNRTAPTVLFGRTGVIEDSWLLLYDKCDGNVAVLEIGYYGEEASLDFAEAMLRTSYPDRQHRDVDREALKLLLDSLRSQTMSDGDRFAGYAPVLQAVAKQVGGETNPARLLSELRKSQQLTVTLRSVVEAVLQREQKKLENLRFQEIDLVKKLYSPTEQLDRLVARLYQGPFPQLPNMSAGDAETYSNALETWVAEHPFLDGDTGTSSAVFQAAICSHALKSNTDAAKNAVQKELTRGEAANPFLYVFYSEKTGSETITLPEEHIGVIYASIRASLARGDAASLSVEEIGDDEGETLKADVDIALYRRGKNETTSLEFQTGSSGTIYLGSHVRDVTINMSRAKVEIGQNGEVILVAPVDVQCRDLAILANKVIVDTPPESNKVIADASPEAQDDAVYLMAKSFSGAPTTALPVTRNQVKLFAAWPGAKNYPWTRFATEPPSVQNSDPQIDEALRRFRKFVIEFRARGNSDLARSHLKIDSQRMIKGTGAIVLESLLDADIVTRYQGRYYLHTDRLGELTGTNYEDCVKSQFGPKAIAFIKKALESDSD